MCISTLKFSDLLAETHLFFYLALSRPTLHVYHITHKQVHLQVYENGTSIALLCGLLSDIKYITSIGFDVHFKAYRFGDGVGFLATYVIADGECYCKTIHIRSIYILRILRYDILVLLKFCCFLI